VLQDNATHVSTKSFGTVAYMPAEVLQHNRMSRGADVYSFAMIMWELLAGRRVYEGYIATQARADLTLP
jgi:serine/threonine protein kinase